MESIAHEHWYEFPVTSALRQGDIFRRLLVMWLPQDLEGAVDPPDNAQMLPVTCEWAAGDWIVMSASCDVDREANSYPQVMLGRVLPATLDNFKVKTMKDFNERAEVVRKGLEPTKFLLPEHPAATPVFPLSFVQYRIHVTMPADYLRRKGQGRLRLKHPLRETFGTWVAGNIGRVGPETATLIPEFTKTYPAHTLKANTH